MIKGSKHTEEAKKKMSENKKGKHYSPATEFKKGHKITWKVDYSNDWKKKVSKGWFKKGNIPWTKGKRMIEATKRKLSKALKGRKAWNKGQQTPEEIKNKLSELLKGKHRSPKTEFKKGQYAGNKNPAKRPEIKIKISRVKKGKPHFNQRGKNHPNWKGGITSESERIRNHIEYRSWREAIFTRDNWTCRKCGQRGGKINVHHLYSFAYYPDLQTAIKNGVTLCKKCHRELHKIYGLKNSAKGKFEEFLNRAYYAKRS